MTGRLASGLLLILFGLVWLLEAFDVVELPWDALVPAALIVVGVALVVAARSGHVHVGLIAAGVVLTGLLVIGSAIDFPIGGGVGERQVRPATFDALRSDYRLGVGKMTLDLTALPAERLRPGSGTNVRVGIGRLVVIVPQGATVRVKAHATLGSVRLFGAEDSGFDVERGILPTLFQEDVTFSLVLSVGIGDVEVRRG